MKERFHLSDPFPPAPKKEELPIGTILSRIMKEEPEPSKLPEIITERWPLIVGSLIAKHTHPAHLNRGILCVYADHPGWLSEVRKIPKKNWIKKFASIPECPEVKDLRFNLDPDVQTWRNQ